ncbi:MAG TPA: DNA polymerase III subunit delta [Chitinophagaceae bacterium]|nr:DNA polymerase III subunit delta [Chitinophagaceae bacterium]MBP7313696.1 DNA polymerase III subunit delta [Chitinophagaceae bacterium]HQV55794.1 DNA polymerase III subunit delta [Chitinophagaceae bacterium]HQX96606.1 DNA polymerase III subunit delta [Chitinophagaceae bacterium]HQZ50667.1 DNA polymerase III subunit delta [Chitinophagaceae bacterium]
MSVDKIINDWKKKSFKPIYWFEGEEEFFIDKAIEYAEHHILSESEASFNLSVFYGKDANWPDIINACKRYPMFAERQVVLLKEAQQMRDVEKLESYIDNPLSSTIFVVSYKDKKLDARKKFAKLVKEKGVLVSTKKMYDKELPQWTQELLQTKGLTITPKGLALLVDHIGNDLTRIENEIDKLSVNLGKRTSITEDDIEKYIGVSKDFNVFELQAALAAKDLSRSIRIIQYFEANPKAAPIQLVLPSLYSFFSKVFMVFGADTQDERAIATAIGVNPFFMKDYLQAAKLYSYPGVEKALLLLHNYNLKSVGVGSIGTDDASLLKEMVVKIMS